MLYFQRLTDVNGWGTRLTFYEISGKIKQYEILTKLLICSYLVSFSNYTQFLSFSGNFKNFGKFSGKTLAFQDKNLYLCHKFNKSCINGTN